MERNEFACLIELEGNNNVAASDDSIFYGAIPGHNNASLIVGFPSTALAVFNDIRFVGGNTQRYGDFAVNFKVRRDARLACAKKRAWHAEKDDGDHCSQDYA